MRRLLVVVSLVAVVATGVLGVSGAGGAAGSVQARWVITDLGTLGGKESEAVAINERGQIVGWSDIKSGNGHAFLWQRGKMTDLGSLAGYSVASDINEHGQVIGASASRTKDEDGDPISHALLWQNGKMLDLTPTAKLKPQGCSPDYRDYGGGDCTASGDLINERGQVVVSMTSNAYTNENSVIDRAFLWQNGRLIDLNRPGGLSDADTYVRAINDRGQIVGVVQTRDDRGKIVDSAVIENAFLWQNGKMTDLGTLPGLIQSGASDINGRGQIVGSSYTSSINPLDSRAFLRQNGRMTDLGTLGGETSGASAINERGQIVGASDTGAKNGDPISHAFLWQDGTMTDLGTLPGQTESSASAMNERGQIIGCGKYDAMNDVCEQAFVWQNGKMTKLAGLGGPTEAVAINQHNQIVGHSSTKTGQEHAVLWTLKPGS